MGQAQKDPTLFFKKHWMFHLGELKYENVSGIYGNQYIWTGLKLLKNTNAQQKHEYRYNTIYMSHYTLQATNDNDTR